MHSVHRFRSPSKSGRLAPESLDDIFRNSWTICAGIGGQFPPDYAATTGNAVCRVSVAVNRPGKSGETDWFNLLAWGKTGEMLNQYGRKGREVHVEGRMQQHRWTDGDGNNRVTWELVANTIQFLDNRNPKVGASDDVSDDIE